MKKVAGILLGAALLGGMVGKVSVNPCNIRETEEEKGVVCMQSVANVKNNGGLQTRAKSAILMDFNTKTVVFGQNEEAHLPIASMCKIMTLLLSFEAIEQGQLDMNEKLTISERAASMGGSQVFLEANAQYPVKELIKSIVVCSANDSCVALAECIAGSEELFVEKMNAKAKELGANDTLFANCTGLPKEPQYSCAKDVSLMLRALLNHQEYYDFGKVWLDKFQHPKGRFTEITNTNKLVRFYDGCDGGKTGFTNEAGFCLAATAKRGDMRVISVVIGEESSANRFEDVRTMFDYAFANYAVTPIFEGGKPLEQAIEVVGGKQERVAVYPQKSAYAFAKKGEAANISVQMQLNKVKAPLEKDGEVGALIVYKDGVEVEKVPLLSTESVGKANVADWWKKIAKKWNSR